MTSALHLVATNRAEVPVRTSAVAARPVSRLPEPEFLDRLAYHSGVFRLPHDHLRDRHGRDLRGVRVGRFWGWDPKVTAAFVTWVCYAAYLHARATSGWRARRAAWINIAGPVVVLFNLFFVNLVVAGLHSYAGVN